MIVAFALSALLHALLTFGDSAWLWWLSTTEASEIKVQATTKTLSGQSLTENATGRRKGPAIEQLTITLAHRQERPPPSIGTTAPELEQPDTPQPTRKVAHRTTIRRPPKATQANAASQLAQLTETLSSSFDATKEEAPAPPGTPTQEDVKPTNPPPPVVQSFPNHVVIHYLARQGAVAGVQAQLVWKRQADRYDITLGARLLGQSVRFESHGSVGPNGLVPENFAEYANDAPQPKRMAKFDWANSQISYGEPSHLKTEPIEKGSQDFLSAAHQFALQGSQLPSFTMTIADGRKLYRFPFELAGETNFPTGDKDISVLLLKGSQNTAVYQILLAPEWNNLPLRLSLDKPDKSVLFVAYKLEIEGKTIFERSIAPPQRDK
ncbi:DUF3108 domain-containing protein [Parachitinimonas caeni]|uniref:DUF3108 domain-containing protein n=1 Tax=Parachitinimonas caeni TaxID=3031301 RepID=A0ABT7DTJ9_9NEIS|nr:DUF3108 domain-containing protein [Parachitinimonas caeni]MDK2123129.1 DUF3108 domain-containing protein [Parachitinimonas caeni]